MKRVLIVYSADISSAVVGGIKNYISQLVSCGKNEKFDLLAVGQLDEISNIPVERLWCFKTHFRPMILSFHYEVFKAWLTGRIKLTQYDTVVFNRHEDILLMPFIRAKRKILIIHGSICYGFKFWPFPVAVLNYLFEKILLPFMDSTYILLKNPKYGIDYYKRTNPWCADKIHYAPVPIGTEFITTTALQKKRNNPKMQIVYFGRIVQNPKNVLLLPEVIHSLIAQGIDANLTVIGDGPDLQSLRNKVDAMGLTCEFTFCGAVPHDKLKNMLIGFDLSLVLSEFEGICMSAIESLSIGIPVAAFPVGDIAEYVHDMINGVLLSNNESIDSNVLKIIDFMRHYKHDDIYFKWLEPYYPENCFSYIHL